jgi:hypothetical protein
MAKSAEREVKKAVKRLHTTTKVLVVLALLVGIGVGSLTCFLMSKNDRFELKGAKSYQIELNTDESPAPFLYTEEGIEAIVFGQDVSGKLTVNTTLQKDAEGRYIIPTDKEGVYTITYTVNAYKFQKGQNGVITRIRTFTVDDIEEDGRDG